VSAHRRLHAVESGAERRTDGDQVHEQARRVLRDEVHALLREIADRLPWMTAATAARYLDFAECQDPVAAFRAWAKRTPDLTCGHRGDVPLWHRDDLDAAVAPNRRRGPVRVAHG